MMHMCVPAHNTHACIAFCAQLRIAAELRRAISVHCVRSDGAFVELLRAEAVC